jgi:hypothetical protein
MKEKTELTRGKQREFLGLQSTEVSGRSLHSWKGKSSTDGNRVEAATEDWNRKVSRRKDGADGQSSRFEHVGPCIGYI